MNFHSLPFTLERSTTRVKTPAWACLVESIAP